MKITRSFTLDIDIVKDLKKEKNQSRTLLFSAVFTILVPGLPVRC